MAPEINFTNPSDITFIGGEAEKPIWVSSTPGLLEGTVSDNVELKGLFYRVLPEIQGVEPDPFTEIPHINGEWSLSLDLSTNVSVEMMARIFLKIKSIVSLKWGWTQKGLH